jgi:hypothetical protein
LEAVLQRRAIFKRMRSGPLARLSLTGKLFYVVACIGFMSLYPNRYCRR